METSPVLVSSMHYELLFSRCALLHGTMRGTLISACSPCPHLLVEASSLLEGMVSQQSLYYSLHNIVGFTMILVWISTFIHKPVDFFFFWGAHLLEKFQSKKKSKRKLNGDPLKLYRYSGFLPQRPARIILDITCWRSSSCTTILSPSVCWWLLRSWNTLKPFL